VSRLVRRLGWIAAGLGLVAVLLVFVFPTTTWLAQRRDGAATAQRARVLQAANRRLEARVRKLHTDAEIERLAREQYDLVRPGEEAYAILPAPAQAQPVVTHHVEAKHHPSLLSRAWARLTGIF
jgi:cell division protein FtsB